jgi:hypothetical protein
VLLGREVPYLGDAKYHSYGGVKCCTDESVEFHLGPVQVTRVTQDAAEGVTLTLLRVEQAQRK